MSGFPKTSLTPASIGVTVEAWSAYLDTLAGYGTDAALATALADETAFTGADNWTLPTGAAAQTFRRTGRVDNAATFLVSGTLALTGIYLRAGQTLTTATFVSGNVAGVLLTNQWFALYTGARALLRVTGDDTNTAWAASTPKTLAFATQYVVPTSGMYYLGAVVAATTVPNLRGALSSPDVTGIAPIITGTADAGLTTPASAPANAAALAAVTSIPWAYVS